MTGKAKLEEIKLEEKEGVLVLEQLETLIQVFETHSFNWKCSKNGTL